MRSFLQKIIFAVFLTASSMAIAACTAGFYLITTTAGSKDAAQFFLKQYIPRDVIVTVGDYTGTIRSGLVLHDITIANIPAFPPDTSIRIQRLIAYVPAFDPRDLSVDIFNGRLDMAGCDPIVIEGKYAKGRVQARAYTRVLDVHTIVSGVMEERFLRNVQGFFTDAEVTIQGTASKLAVTGAFFVDRVRYLDTTVSQGPGRIEAVLDLTNSQAPLSGDLMMESGLVNTRNRDVDLLFSKAMFRGGDLSDPALDIHGTTRVENININFVITGRLYKSKLTLNSDPPLPEDVLWAVLAGGKTWTPAMEGSHGERRVDLKKKITDDFKLGLEFEETPVRPGQPVAEYSRTLEGEMSLTERFSLNVAEKLLSAERSLSTQTDPTNTDSRRQSESQIYLKYKNTF